MNATAASRLAAVGGPATISPAPESALPRGDRRHAQARTAPGWIAGAQNGGIDLRMEGAFAGRRSALDDAALGIRDLGGVGHHVQANQPVGPPVFQSPRGWVERAEALGARLNKAPRLSVWLTFAAVAVLAFELVLNA